MLAANSGGDGGDAWAERLGAILDAEPLAPSVFETIRPMATLGLVDGNHVMQLLHDKRGEMCTVLKAKLCPEYDVECALAIWLYTIENPALYRIVNGGLRSPERLTANGDVSQRCCRAGLPRLLDRGGGRRIAAAGLASRRRDCHAAAPPSPFSRRFRCGWRESVSEMAVSQTARLGRITTAPLPKPAAATSAERTKHLRRRRRQTANGSARG